MWWTSLSVSLTHSVSLKIGFYIGVIKILFILNIQQTNVKLWSAIKYNAVRLLFFFANSERSINLHTHTRMIPIDNVSSDQINKIIMWFNYFLTVHTIGNCLRTLILIDYFIILSRGLVRIILSSMSLSQSLSCTFHMRACLPLLLSANSWHRKKSLIEKCVQLLSL